MGFLSSSSGPSAETAKTLGPEIEALLNSYSAESILDYIARRVGHEPQMPGWTEPLRELHRHSRKIGLQVIPDFWYTPVFNPDAVPAPVWNGAFFDCAAFSLERGLEFLRKHPEVASESVTWHTHDLTGDPIKQPTKIEYKYIPGAGL